MGGRVGSHRSMTVCAGESAVYRSMRLWKLLCYFWPKPSQTQSAHSAVVIFGHGKKQHHPFEHVLTHRYGEPRETERWREKKREGERDVNSVPETLSSSTGKRIPSFIVAASAAATESGAKSADPMVREMNSFLEFSSCGLSALAVRPQDDTRR